MKSDMTRSVGWPAWPMGRIARPDARWLAIVGEDRRQFPATRDNFRGCSEDRLFVVPWMRLHWRHIGQVETGLNREAMVRPRRRRLQWRHDERDQCECDCNKEFGSSHYLPSFRLWVGFGSRLKRLAPEP